MSKITRTFELLQGTKITREEGSAPVFSGHAAVFDQPTLIGSKRWGFIEQIGREAFTDVLDDDVRLLINHRGLPLARTTNGTLRLSVDSEGLHNEADLADTTEGRDIVTLLERGDVDQQSFAFTIDSEEWSETEYEGVIMDLRTITKIERLYDTSIVTYPAYEGATGGMKRETVSDDEVESTLKRVKSDKDIEKDKAARIQQLRANKLLLHK